MGFQNHNLNQSWMLTRMTANRTLTIYGLSLTLVSNSKDQVQYLLKIKFMQINIQVLDRLFLVKFKINVFQVSLCGDLQGNSKKHLCHQNWKEKEGMILLILVFIHLYRETYFKSKVMFALISVSGSMLNTDSEGILSPYC